MDTTSGFTVPPAALIAMYKSSLAFSWGDGAVSTVLLRTGVGALEFTQKPDVIT